MKCVGVLSTFIFLVAGLQLTLAQQGATSCRDIAASLRTMEIDPITGSYNFYVWHIISVTLINNYVASFNTNRPELG